MGVVATPHSIFIAFFFDLRVLCAYSGTNCSVESLNGSKQALSFSRAYALIYK
jgi:hypothetical protein